MPLRDDQRRRFARHLLLAEMGDAQQAALCEAHVTLASDGDAGVARVAKDYLVRAGVRVSGDGDGDGDDHDHGYDHGHGHGCGGVGVTEGRVEALAGDPALIQAARALAGAFEAVEAIKRITGLGTAGELPEGLTLTGEGS